MQAVQGAALRSDGGSGIRAGGGRDLTDRDADDLFDVRGGDDGAVQADTGATGALPAMLPEGTAERDAGGEWDDRCLAGAGAGRADGGGRGWYSTDARRWRRGLTGSEVSSRWRHRHGGTARVDLAARGKVCGVRTNRAIRLYCEKGRLPMEWMPSDKP